MNSELGMILPFAFVMFAVWSGTRIIIARMQIQKSPFAGNEQLVADLAKRIQQLEESLETTTREVQRLTEAERFTAQLLSGRSPVGGAAQPLEQRYR